MSTIGIVLLLLLVFTLVLMLVARAAATAFAALILWGVAWYMRRRARRAASPVGRSAR